MDIKEHVKCYCSFWKPTVARRITLSFLIFGMIIFLVTSFLYMIAGKKQFMRSTSQLIRHQFSQLENSGQPDFIRDGINESQPDLQRLLDMLANLSSSFYSVSDISIYSKAANGSSWYRLYFPDVRILHSEPIEDLFTKKLDHRLKKRFHRPNVDIFSAGGSHAMFVNITGENDVNDYFLKIGVYNAGIAGFMQQQAVHFLVFFLVALFLLRFFGYFFARKIAAPIENLSEISTEVAKGDLSTLAPVTTNDEIGELSKNFNQMIEGLRERERIKLIEFELEKGRQIQAEFLPKKKIGDALYFITLGNFKPHSLAISRPLITRYVFFRKIKNCNLSFSESLSAQNRPMGTE